MIQTIFSLHVREQQFLLQLIKRWWMKVTQQLSEPSAASWGPVQGLRTVTKSFNVSTGNQFTTARPPPQLHTHTHTHTHTYSSHDAVRSGPGKQTLSDTLFTNCWHQPIRAAAAVMSSATGKEKSWDVKSELWCSGLFFFFLFHVSEVVEMNWKLIYILSDLN